jgi:DNA repair ATPase RecN
MNLIKKYRLQSEMEHLKVGNEDWFKEYLRAVLEDDSKPSFQKADYIAYSINQISNQIDYVSNEIKELQAIKKNLVTSKDLAMQLTASVLQEYGLEKLEGATVSSITITPQKSKTTQSLFIKDEKEVMARGYFKVSIDEDAILEAMKTQEGLEELDELVSINTITETTPSKIKINNKRSSANTLTQSVGELFSIEEAA